MSVLECDRGTCSNIMCDHLILDRRYYICIDCLNELRSHWTACGAGIDSQGDIKRFIEAFMNSDGGIQQLEHVRDDTLFEEVLNDETPGLG